LFRDSDRDIIREIADRGLEKEGMIAVRKIAGLWKETLREGYRKFSNDIGRLYDMLRRAGCNRNLFTVKNWLSDDDIIGPRDESDISAIARAFGNPLLKDNILKVQEAISTVRSAHRQASEFLKKKLLDALPEIIKGEQYQVDFVSKNSVVMDLEEFGKVYILRVEEIESDFREVETKWVNRLLVAED